MAACIFGEHLDYYLICVHTSVSLQDLHILEPSSKVIQSWEQSDRQLLVINSSRAAVLFKFCAFAKLSRMSRSETRSLKLTSLVTSLFLLILFIWFEKKWGRLPSPYGLGVHLLKLLIELGKVCVDCVKGFPFCVLCFIFKGAAWSEYFGHAFTLVLFSD